MTERERLIELLQDWGNKENDGVRAESIADYLLANGVVVPLFKTGDTVYRICKRIDGRKNGYIRRIEITPHNFGFSEICLKRGIYFLTREEAERELRMEENYESGF